jgi:hypothetical protein
MTDRTWRDASAGTGLLDAPTAPLTAPAADALARLELAFAPLPVRRAVVRYRNASAVTVELSAVMDYRSLTVPEFNDLEFAQDTMRESRQILAQAGRLDLIGGA